MTPEEAYELQLELECKRLLDSGRLREVPCNDPDGLALISVARFPQKRDDGHIHLREDAPPAVVALLDGISAADLLHASEADLAALGLRRNFSGRTGVFRSAPAAEVGEGVVNDAGTWVLDVGGVRASAAFSARESASAAELSVETVPECRRRGYGRRVASAWARDAMARGLIAFYSYDFSNTASARLARSLDIEIMFEAGSFDPR